MPPCSLCPPPSPGAHCGLMLSASCPKRGPVHVPFFWEAEVICCFPVAWPLWLAQAPPLVKSLQIKVTLPRAAPKGTNDTPRGVPSPLGGSATPERPLHFFPRPAVRVSKTRRSQRCFILYTWLSRAGGSRSQAQDGSQPPFLSRPS